MEKDLELKLYAKIEAQSKRINDLELIFHKIIALAGKSESERALREISLACLEALAGKNQREIHNIVG